MTDQTVEPIRKSNLPCTPPPEWEFHTWFPHPDGGGDMVRGERQRGVLVRRRVSYSDWEPVRPDRWADEPETAAASAAVVPAADRAAVLREAVRRIEDGELLPDRGLRFRRGADWVLDALRRLAAEAAAPGVGVAADTTPAGERPRCPDCGLPHDLTPGSLPMTACQNIRHRIAEAERLHAEGDHGLCCRRDCEALRATDPTPGPLVPAQPGDDTPVVAYRSHSGSLLRCLTHAPDQTGLDNGAFHPVTAGDLPHGGICTYRAPGVECGVDVLNPQQPKEA